MTICDIADDSYAGDNGCFNADPLFAAAPGDPTLGLLSPCAGAGLAAAAPSADIAGRARPALPAVGAYEGVAGEGQPISANSGQIFFGTLAAFSDGCRSPHFTVSIDWGDGTGPDTQTGVVGGNLSRLLHPGPAHLRAARPLSRQRDPAG